MKGSARKQVRWVYLLLAVFSLVLALTRGARAEEALNPLFELHVRDGGEDGGTFFQKELRSFELPFTAGLKVSDGFFVTNLSEEDPFTVSLRFQEVSVNEEGEYFLYSDQRAFSLEDWLSSPEPVRIEPQTVQEVLFSVQFPNLVELSNDFYGLLLIEVNFENEQLMDEQYGLRMHVFPWPEVAQKTKLQTGLKFLKFPPWVHVEIHNTGNSYWEGAYQLGFVQGESSSVYKDTEFSLFPGETWSFESTQGLPLGLSWWRSSFESTLDEKSWTEDLGRVFFVGTGHLIVLGLVFVALTFFSSLAYFRKKRKLSALLFIGVGVTGFFAVSLLSGLWKGKEIDPSDPEEEKVENVEQAEIQLLEALSLVPFKEYGIQDIQLQTTDMRQEGTFLELETLDFQIEDLNSSEPAAERISSGALSRLADGTVLQISEVIFGSTREITGVELYNPSEETVRLESYSLVVGVDRKVLSGALDAGAYYVVEMDWSLEDEEFVLLLNKDEEEMESLSLVYQTDFESVAYFEGALLKWIQKLIQGSVDVDLESGWAFLKHATPDEANRLVNEAPMPGFILASQRRESPESEGLFLTFASRSSDANEDDLKYSWELKTGEVDGSSENGEGGNTVVVQTALGEEVEFFVPEAGPVELKLLVQDEFESFGTLWITFNVVEEYTFDKQSLFRFIRVEKDWEEWLKAFKEKEAEDESDDGEDIAAPNRITVYLEKMEAFIEGIERTMPSYHVTGEEDGLKFFQVEANYLFY